MKLHYGTISPYVRKVMLVAHEKGLIDRIELVACNPWEETDLAGVNPIGKIPALEIGDGMVLFDSRVICEYLDAHGAGPALYPQGEARWPVLRLAALGEGLLEAGIALANDTRKDPAHWSEWYADRVRTKLRRTLDCLETEAASLEGPVDIARLTVGCALGYLDFRGFIGDWRPTRPNLANWYADFAKRPSMQATEPKA